MRSHKYIFSFLLLAVTLGLSPNVQAHGYKDSLNALNVFQLSSDYRTDEICVPKVGMHYLDLTKPVYGNPQAGFDTNGRLLFVQYLFTSEDFDAQIKSGLISKLKMHNYAITDHLKIKFGQARPEFIPPQYRDIVCNPEKPESNLCLPHYDLTFFVVSERRLQRACEGAEVPTRFPDPRGYRSEQSVRQGEGETR